MSVAVHFGAGNIGRGFVGLLLHEAGYEVVFADVAAPLIDALAAADSYTVHEVGAGAQDHVVTGFRAVNSAQDEAGVVAEVAAADVVTCAVGPTVLRFIAPVIARGLVERDPGTAPLAVMACENAINATDRLREFIVDALPEGERDAALAKAVFANTAVDRIVPAQPADAGLDVTVETYFEWAIDRTPFPGTEPTIPGAHYVDGLAASIERKLFTVNTGHATVAYHGYLAGADKISDAIAIPAVRSALESVLGETSDLLVRRHELDPEVHRAYVTAIIARFENPHLPDTVTRVGRQPLRKLSRDERFVSPGAALAEEGVEPTALLDAMGAALRFDVPDDEQSVELQALLRSDASDTDVAQQITGLEAGHPFLAPFIDRVAAVRA
ncbi:mannitol-1-phosphate 5-dehydrogenase [Curtobacterium sp. MCBD17_040]|uniref:mannitol-1-phosphate 5-dehydrogenase n=1 Tax=Curtobacterium sp. MCBD17_040 TaxID=2175674 RepID=UPI000DA764B2|nr:mannitol-1-phosphate 5-dehydrogenase [Curtobacterium sp. MCBD17_040]WIB62611.1 mannitol-1-phosphate 5-dehydrogenase [Curtobacterium sp. MCBD17_040]